MSAVLLALGASISWGVGDFLGGITSRRHGVLTVLAVSQAAGLLAVALWVALATKTPPGVADVAPAIGAGVAGVVGLGALYRGFAVGAIGVVAPISSAAAIVPLTVGLAEGEQPAGTQIVGGVLALVGVMAASREPGAARGSFAAGAVLGLLAALGFGTYFVGLDAAADGGVAWAVCVARATSTVASVLVALILGVAMTTSPRGLGAMMLIGILDVGANILLGLALTTGYLSISAVLASLYPAVTVALAWRLLGERLSTTQRAGGAAVLVGAALVAAG